MANLNDVPTIELIMSEFGSNRQNAGGARFQEEHVLNPSLDSFRAIFPGASVTLYTDQRLKIDGVTTIRVVPPFDREEPRYGWRAHDFYQAYGLLHSTADVAVALDSDMRIVSPDFRAILRFAALFGLALPINPRLLLRVDGTVGVDSTYRSEFDETFGSGMTFNLTPMAFATRHAQARALLHRYCDALEMKPGRGAVHLVEASYALGFQPYVLPPQWCVCSPRDLDSRHLWSEAIALHVGHKDVLPRYMRERKRRWFQKTMRRMVGK